MRIKVKNSRLPHSKCWPGARWMAATRKTTGAKSTSIAAPIPPRIPMSKFRCEAAFHPSPMSANWPRSKARKDNTVAMPAAVKWAATAITTPSPRPSIQKNAIDETIYVTIAMDAKKPSRSRADFSLGSMRREGTLIVRCFSFGVPRCGFRDKDVDGARHEEPDEPSIIIQPTNARYDEAEEGDGDPADQRRDGAEIDAAPIFVAAASKVEIANIQIGATDDEIVGDHNACDGTEEA